MTKVSILIRQMAKEGHKLQSLERASVLAASDDPKDQDKAREIKTRFDYESLKRQIGSKKKPDKPAVKESMGGGVPLTPQELEIQKKMSKLNVRLAKKRSQQMQKAKIKDTETSPEQVKEGSLHKWFKGSKSKDGKPGWVNVKTGGTCASDEPGEGTPKCVSSSKRASMTKAERESASRRKKAADPNQQQKSGAAKPTYVRTDAKKKMNEAKVDKGRSDYGKATIRNWRHSGPSTVEPAMFDPENKRGKTIDKRREEHKARRGVKGAKVPTYTKEEVIGEEGYDRMRDDRLVKYGIGHDGSDRKGPSPRPTGKQPKGDTVYQKEMKKKYGGKLPSALQVVTDKIRERHGKGAIADAK